MLNPLNMLGITLHKEPQLLVKPVKDLAFPLISLFQRTLSADPVLPTSHRWIAFVTRLTLGIGFAYATKKTCDWIKKEGIFKAQKFLNEKFKLQIPSELVGHLTHPFYFVSYLLITFLGNRLDQKTTTYMGFAYALYDTYKSFKKTITSIGQGELSSVFGSLTTFLHLNIAHRALFHSQTSEYAAQILKSVSPTVDPVVANDSLFTLDQVAAVVPISNPERQLPLPQLLDLISRSNASMSMVRSKALTPGFLTPIIESFANTLAPQMARLFGYSRV